MAASSSPDTLGVREIGELLIEAGGRAEVLARDASFVNAARDMSDGDPLHLTFLVNDILAGTIASIGDLHSRFGSLEDHLDQWWHGLGERLGEQAAKDLVGYLLAARGPMSRDELANVSQDDALDRTSLESGGDPLLHSVGGDPACLVLANPRLRRYLSEERVNQHDQGFYRHRLIDFCRQWKNDSLPYALANFAEHLAENSADPGCYAELVSLATSKTFADLQRAALPDEVDLPARTARIALGVAAEHDDAPAMVALAILHALRLREARSPLEAARAGKLDACWDLIDRQRNELVGLWYLLIGCDLDDRGKSSDAREALNRIWERATKPEVDLQLGDAWIDCLAQMLTRLGGEPRVLAYLGPPWPMSGVRDRLVKELLKRGAGEVALKVVTPADSEASGPDELRRIAAIQVALGDRDGAWSTLRTAFTVAQADDPGRYHALKLAWIGVAQAEADDADGAQTTLQAAFASLPDAGSVDDQRAQALVQISRAQARLGDFEAAIETARLIGAETHGSQLSNSALTTIAIAQVIRGDFAAAASTVRSIDPGSTPLDSAVYPARPPFAVSALAEIAVTEARVGDFATAISTARSIDEPVARVKAVTQIVEAQPHAETPEAVASILGAELEVARSIGGCQHAQALTQLAAAFARAGNPEQARSVFSEALAATTSLELAPDPLVYRIVGSMISELVADIAVGQALMGDLSTAVTTTSTIEAEARSSALGRVAAAQAQLGNFADATERARSVQSSYERAMTFEAIAAAQVQAGDTVGAKDSLAAGLVARTAGRSVDRVILRATALGQIAAAQVQAGNLAQAAATAQLIDDRAARAHVLGGIAGAHAQRGDFAIAWATALSIEGVHATTTPAGDFLHVVRFSANEKEWAEAVGQIAVAHAQRGDPTAALEAVGSIWLEDVKARVLGWIAVAQAQARDAVAALNTARSIPVGHEWGISPPREVRASATAEIAVVQAHRGEFAGALETASSIQRSDERARTIGRIAAAQAQMGDRQGAEQTLEAALETARTIDDRVAHSSVRGLSLHQGSLRSTTLGAIALSLAATGNFTDASAIAHSIDEPAPRRQALGDVAVAQAEAHDFIAAMETVRSIEDGRIEAEALAGIAAAHTATGNITAAVNIARSITGRDVVTGRDLTGSPKILAQTWGRIAVAAANMGQVAEAQSLFAEAERSLADTDVFSMGAVILARDQITVGLGDQAMRLARPIMAHSDSQLSTLASACAAVGDKTTFKRLLVMASDHVDAVYALSSAAAMLYPDATSDIARKVAVDRMPDWNHIKDHILRRNPHYPVGADQTPLQARDLHEWQTPEAPSIDPSTAVPHISQAKSGPRKPGSSPNQ